jgi:hypothetical protein
VSDDDAFNYIYADGGEQTYNNTPDGNLVDSICNYTIYQVINIKGNKYIKLNCVCDLYSLYYFTRESDDDDDEMMSLERWSRRFFVITFIIKVIVIVLFVVVYLFAIIFIVNYADAGLVNDHLMTKIEIYSILKHRVSDPSRKSAEEAVVCLLMTMSY